MTRMTGQNGGPLSSRGCKIVSSISTFVLNTLTLKKGLFRVFLMLLQQGPISYLETVPISTPKTPFSPKDFFLWIPFGDLEYCSDSVTAPCVANRDSYKLIHVRSLLNIQVKINTYIYKFYVISLKVKVHLKYSLLIKLALRTFRFNTG